MKKDYQIVSHYKETHLVQRQGQDNSKEKWLWLMCGGGCNNSGVHRGHPSCPDCLEMVEEYEAKLQEKDPKRYPQLVFVFVFK